MGRHGPEKGSAFERRMCRTLSLWVSDLKRDDLFWRTSQSGGRATFRAKRGLSAEVHVADISAIHPMGNRLLDHFVVECKHWKNCQFPRLICRGDGVLIDWWNKLQEEGASVGKKPLLIFRQNNMPIMAGMTSTGWRWFAGRKTMPVTIVLPQHGLHIVQFNEVSTIPFSQIRKRNGI